MLHGRLKDNKNKSRKNFEGDKLTEKSHFWEINGGR